MLENVWQISVIVTGSILEPILFLIYVNDINSAKFAKIVDDTTIITTGATLEKAVDKMNPLVEQGGKMVPMQ